MPRVYVKLTVHLSNIHIRFYVFISDMKSKFIVGEKIITIQIRYNSISKNICFIYRINKVKCIYLKSMLIFGFTSFISKQSK